MIFRRDDFRNDKALLTLMRDQMLNGKSEKDRRNWRVFLAWLNDYTYEDLAVSFDMSSHKAMEIVHKCCRRYNQIKKEAA